MTKTVKEFIHIKMKYTLINHILLLLALAFLFSSFNMQKKLTGEYSYNGLGRYYLRLNQDSTYYYTYDFGWKLRRSFGKWSVIDEKRIQLKSMFDVNMLSLSVTEKSNDFNEQKNVKITPILGVELDLKHNLIYEIIVNGELYEKNNTEIFFVDRSIETLQVAILIDSNVIISPYRPRLLTQEYKVKDSSANSIEMSIPLSTDFFYYDEFSTDTLYVKRKGLLWSSKNSNILKKCKNELNWKENFPR